MTTNETATQRGENAMTTDEANARRDNAMTATADQSTTRREEAMTTAAADQSTTRREDAMTTTAADPSATRRDEAASTTGGTRLSTADFAAQAPVERQPADRPDSARSEALFPGGESQTFQSRWSEIQASFVDEPRQSVEQADGLVAEVMQRLAQVFAEERSRLEKQWDRGEDMDTEALRQALRRYRSFFDRLLSM